MGRVPAQTSAIVLHAEPGAELVCTAHNLPLSHPAQPRGIISYYATTALFEARSMGEWLAQIESLVAADVEAGLLPPFYRPQLQPIGLNCNFWGVRVNLFSDFCPRPTGAAPIF